MSQQLTQAPTFIPLPAYIFADKRLSCEDKLIWGGVIGLSGDEETVYEDHPLLQRLIKNDYAAVRKSLDHLVELNLLEEMSDGLRRSYEPLKNALMFHPIEL